jgi:hypothetical protein
MQPRESFPSLPPLSAEQYRALNRDQLWRRFIAEIEAAAREFKAAQALGVDPFTAAELTPVARANRSSSKQSDLRRLYAGMSPAK